MGAALLGVEEPFWIDVEFYSTWMLLSPSSVLAVESGAQCCLQPRLWCCMHACCWVGFWGMCGPF
jgi:hypothetical protein